MPRQQCQLSLPITIPAGNIVVNWSVRADETAPLSSSTGYNNRRYNTLGGGEIATTVLLAIQALPVSGTWTLSERAGFLGRVRLQCTNTQTITSLTLPTGLGAILGFASDVLTPTITGSIGAWVSTFDAPYRALGLWIPEPASEVYFDPFDVRQRGTVLGAQALSGAATLDVYPTIKRRFLTFNSIRGYSAQQSYLQADFGAEQGVDTSDPNFAWDSFVRTWRRQASPIDASLQCAARLALDVADPATFEVVYPDTQAEWIADPLSACTVVSLAPLMMVLSVELLMDGATE